MHCLFGLIVTIRNDNHMIMGSLNSSEFFCACLFDCPDATHHVTRMSDFLVHLHDCSRCRIDNFFVFF